MYNKTTPKYQKPTLGGLLVDYRHDFYTERVCLALNERNYWVEQQDISSQFGIKF